MAKFRVEQYHVYVQEYEVEAEDQYDAMAKVINEDVVVRRQAEYAFTPDTFGMEITEDEEQLIYDKYEIYCEGFVPSIRFIQEIE